MIVGVKSWLLKLEGGTNMSQAVATSHEDRSYIPADEDFRLWRFLDHTRYAISRSREIELASFGLTPEQVYVLDIIDVSGGATTIGTIVDMTLRQHNTVSTLVDRMAKRGLIKKKRSETDQRQYEIAMTKSGRELFGKLTIKSIEAVFSALTKEEKRELSSTLSRLLSRAYEVSGKKWTFTEDSIPCSG